MQFDPKQMYDDVKNRLVTIVGPQFSPFSVNRADNVRDAFARGVGGYAVYFVFDGSKSRGRLVQSGTKQLLDPLSFTLVCLAPRIGTLATGIYEKAEQLLKACERALATRTASEIAAHTQWRPATCLSPAVFVQDYFVGDDGPQVGYGAQFHTKAEDFL